MSSNSKFKEYFKQGDLFFSGMAVDGECFEVIESKTHKWFVAVQFHPEYKSSPFVPHPLFMSFIGNLK